MEGKGGGRVGADSRLQQGRELRGLLEQESDLERGKRGKGSQNGSARQVIVSLCTVCSMPTCARGARNTRNTGARER